MTTMPQPASSPETASSASAQALERELAALAASPVGASGWPGLSLHDPSPTGVRCGDGAVSIAVQTCRISERDRLSATRVVTAPDSRYRPTQASP